jgi:Family of unknown function (DUF6232)
MSTRTYYRGPDAVVTDKFLFWHTAPTKGFVLRDVRNVSLVRTQDNRLRAYTALFVAALTILAIAAVGVLGSSVVYALGALAIAAPAVLVAVWSRPPVRSEIHATYRGVDVVLYASSDVRAFGQVARALRRAIEHARYPSDASAYPSFSSGDPFATAPSATRRGAASPPDDSLSVERDAADARPQAPRVELLHLREQIAGALGQAEELLQQLAVLQRAALAVAYPNLATEIAENEDAVRLLVEKFPTKLVGSDVRDKAEAERWLGDTERQTALVQARTEIWRRRLRRARMVYRFNLPLTGDAASNFATARMLERIGRLSGELTTYISDADVTAAAGAPNE